MQLQIIHSIQEFETLISRWHPLDAVECSAGYLEHALDWLPRQSPRVRPFIVAISDEKGLIAMALWCIRYRAGTRWITGVGDTDVWYHDPLIFDPARREEACALLADCLEKANGAWDLIRFSLRAEVSAPLLQHLGRLGWYVETRQEWVVADFEKDWESFWNGRSAKFRQGIRRSIRKLESYPHQFVSADESNFDRLLQALFRLHSARWNSRSWTSYYAELTQICRTALQRNELILTALQIEDRVIAASLSLRSGTWAQGLIMGHDPDYSSLSPGILLNLWEMEQMCRAGVRKLDFGAGDYAWKRNFQTGSTVGLRAHIARRGSLFAMAIVYWETAIKAGLRQNAWILTWNNRLKALLQGYRPRTSTHSPA